MTKRTLLGMLTPSSNTALEPITSAMVAGLPNVSAHFSRFKVTEIALSSDALAQFDVDARGLQLAQVLVAVVDRLQLAALVALHGTGHVVVDQGLGVVGADQIVL